METSKLYSSVSHSRAFFFPEDAAHNSRIAFSYRISHSKQCHSNQVHLYIHYRIVLGLSTFAVPFTAVLYFLTMCFASSRCPFNNALRRGCWCPSYIENNRKVSSFMSLTVLVLRSNTSTVSLHSKFLIYKHFKLRQVWIVRKAVQLNE